MNDSASIDVDTDLPAVSYVMPVLNEESYIERALDSVLAQQYPGRTEVVLALGPSTDRTNEIVARRSRTDPRIRTVAVSEAVIAVALNRAVQACRYPVIARIDAHVELPPGYTLQAVRTLVREGAANVGGVMVAVGKPGFQTAIARAYNSRWGLGGAAYHRPDAVAGEAESAYLGVLDAEVLAQVGYFDESLARGEDWELNQRIRAAGRLVWLDPALRVTYRPRARLRSLMRQHWATGVWRAALVRRLKRANSIRYFVPPILVVCTAMAAATDAVAAAGHTGPVLDALAAPASFGVLAYATLVIAVAARSSGSAGDRMRFALVLVTMHFSWGSGFLLGIARGPGRTVDTSRIPRAFRQPRNSGPAQ